jgi:hypothetical protein
VDPIDKRWICRDKGGDYDLQLLISGVYLVVRSAYLKPKGTRNRQKQNGQGHSSRRDSEFSEEIKEELLFTVGVIMTNVILRRTSDVICWRHFAILWSLFGSVTHGRASSAQKYSKLGNSTKPRF